VRPLRRAEQLVELTCTASASRYWVFWIKKTIRNVTIVVPVLITSCQVSLNRKIGPVTAQARTTAAASRKAEGAPEIRDTFFANWVNREAEFALMSRLRSSGP
jgi:hypothetical protein